MLRIKLFIIGFIGAAMLFTSCDEDGTGGGIGGGGNADAPSVFIFDDGTGTTQTELSDNTVEPGQEFRIAVEGVAGEALLSAVSVLRDGFRLSAQSPDEFDNLNLDDLDEQDLQALPDDLKQTFVWTFQFVAPQEEGDYFYEFEVRDEASLTSSAGLNITVFQQLPDVDPMLTYNGAPSISSMPGTLNGFEIEAVMGTNEFESISVWEDGVPIEDVTRLRFLDSNIDAEFGLNPMPLFAPESQGFAGPVFIRSVAGNHDYVIRLTDTEGVNADVTFSIEETIVSTPLDEEFEFILVSNASGPDLGGLDLDNGVAVASASGDAEIRDLGIDSNQPAATNWIQRVEPVNGAMLRVVDTSMLPEGFTFDSVDSKELVAAAFNTGTASDPSPVLQTGDILAVASPNNIYIMQVDEVGVTDNDNNDFYRFSIKW